MTDPTHCSLAAWTGKKRNSHEKWTYW